MLQALNPRTLTLLAVMAFVLGGGAIYLQYNSMVETQAKARELDEEVPDEQELNRSLQEAQNKAKELHAELVHLETGVHQLAYIPTLLKEIEALGSQANVKVTGVRPVPPPPTPPGVAVEKKVYETVDIDLAGKGDFQSVITMLDLLKQFPKIVAVQTITLVPKVEGTAVRYDHIDVQLRLKAFVFPVNQTPASTAVEVAARKGGSTS